MTINKFTSRYEEEKELYLKWGECVLNYIVSNLKNTSFQIPPKVRIKDTKSLIMKAFYRDKNYSDPYNDITDKVGLRFVVLLGSEIYELNDLIEESSIWEYSKDRDFEQERLDEPLAFDYQSMHYILTSNSQITFNDVIIPEGITCEIQVRTLLQHAYSELSHSRVYKPSFDPSAKVKRVVAKSMALLETTDEYFEEVNDRMNDIAAYNLLDNLTKLLEDTIDSKVIVSSKSNLHIIDIFHNEIDNNEFSISHAQEFIPIVKINFNKTFLNSQPIIFFIYFMAYKKKSILISKWSLTKEELRPIFTQLGISLNDLG